MIHDGIALHNVVELEPAPGGGQYLRRFPRAVRDALSPLGRMVSQESCGVEIRFVTDSPNFRLALGTEPSVLRPWERHNQDIFVFRGPYFHAHHRLTPGQINYVDVINIPVTDKFSEVTADCKQVCGFSHNVWRVLIGRFPAVFYSLDTFGLPHRPPTADEVPKTCWLAYGSSITSGGSATLHHGAYIYHAARALGIDVLNQGLSGSCHCEPAVADYLAAREDWQLITLELGVNMRGGFTPEQFQERSQHLVEKICNRHPNRPVVLVTIFPNSGSSGRSASPDSASTRSEVAFNEALRKLPVHQYPHLHLIEGSDVLDQFESLTTDLIHPGDYGHAQMGMNLGRRLRDFLPH